LVCLAIALGFHPASTPQKLAIFCGVTAVLGFIVEAVGVNTGLIFGSYEYGDVLGFKVFDTPLSISVNWVLVSYCAAACVSFWGKSWSLWVKTSVASLLMVGHDVLIEPIAIKTNMWTWATQSVPIQNYFGWFLVSLPIQALFHWLFPRLENKVAVGVFILQCLFFSILNFLNF
jgi:bisanhydrobacterioruberin hydratase